MERALDITREPGGLSSSHMGKNGISTKMVGLFIGHFLFIFVYVYAALLMNVIGRAYLFKVGRSRTCFHITCVQS